MSRPRFPILGTEIPPMLGRQDIMEQLWKDLTKKTPSHLSLVGPRFAGKSVILRALEERMLDSGTPYCAVIAWDLGHQTPRSDEEFIKLLTRRLGEGLLKTKPDLGEYLLQEGAGYDDVRDVI